MSALHTPALGGLGVALAKMAVGGRLGAKVDWSLVPGAEGLAEAEVMFSESNSRFLAAVAPEKAAAFEKCLAGIPFAKIGTVTEEPVLVWNGGTVAVDALTDAYKSTLAGL